MFQVAFIAEIPLSNSETALDRTDRGQTEDRQRTDKDRQKTDRGHTGQTEARQRPDRGQTEDRQGTDRTDSKKTKLTFELDFPGNLCLAAFLPSLTTLVKVSFQFKAPTEMIIKFPRTPKLPFFDSWFLALTRQN